jgi:hypothetical protein
MYTRFDFGTPYNPRAITGKCPVCGHAGTFDPVEVSDLHIDPARRFAGQRRCPNPTCHALLFVVFNPDGEVVAMFPALRIDFEKQGVPGKILDVFQEAITCHAEECYIAAAIMIRRTLEEICEDKGAQGHNLKDRITDLGGKIVIPKELMAGMDDLRLLGNDAAHVESKAFEKVSKEEVEVGIEFAKEIIKGVYQYDHLLKRLQALKKPKP